MVSFARFANSQKKNEKKKVVDAMIVGSNRVFSNFTVFPLFWVIFINELVPDTMNTNLSHQNC